VEWWDARQTFDLYVSQLVLDEAAVAQAMIPRCSAHPGSWWRNNMTPRDSIVEEVRAIRDAIAKEFDYDIELLGRALQERQAKGGRPVVRLAPKRILPEKKVG